jgi:DNA-binding NtrC family response regulator
VSELVLEPAAAEPSPMDAERAPAPHRAPAHTPVEAAVAPTGALTQPVSEKYYQAGMRGKLLIVDDDPDAAELLRDALVRRGHDCDAVTSSTAALERLRNDDADLVITDVLMDGMSGLELCRQLRSAHPDILTIVVTGHGSLEVAIEAIRAGAYDFVLKPVSLDALAIAVTRALEYQALRGEVRRLRRRVESGPIEGIVGDSPAIRELTSLIQQVSDNDAMVLVTGESGTGKELVARAIHARSPRKDQPFVAVNCAAMPASLLESELFGHVRGAFTDAKRSRPGLILQAAAGTLFLDEIGEMPLEMQAKLLRVLQERTVRPVGGDQEVPFEARLVTATNRDLEHEVEEKRFREDLYYRINVVHIAVPPLRARQGDVLALAQYFLRRIAERTGKHVEGIGPEAAQRLLDYDWPGNVRELENCMERAVALTRTTEIPVDCLPDKVRNHKSSRLVIDAADPSELITLGEMEKRYVRRVLSACGGNKTQAARVLGIDRRSLYRRLEGDA